MTEILITPQVVSASAQVASRGTESRANESTRADTEGGTHVPFAAVLKSRSEKQPAESGKQASSEAESPPATDPGTAVATVAPPILLTMLEADQPLAPNLQQAELAPAVAPAGLDQTDAFILLASASSPAQNTSSTSALAPLDTPLHSAAGPVNPANAETPAPALLKGVAPGIHSIDAQRNVQPAASLPIENHMTPDKLAAEAAIAATAARSGTTSTDRDLNVGQFHTTLEHVSNGPAAIGIQTNGASAPMAPTTGLRVETPLGQASWRDEVGQKLTWMVSNGKQQAELVLNPPQLGRIEVTLTLDDARASISFSTPHAAVREALENSIWRLREMLAETGVSLGQTHVGADSRNYQNPMLPQNDRHASNGSAGAGHAATVSLPGSESVWRSSAGRGMVDVFA